MAWQAVADDLTGAADLAGSLARPGRPVLVAGSAIVLGGQAGSVVLDAATRFLPPAQARLASQRAWLQLGQPAGPFLRYQKIDSTLRGHPGAEIEGLLLATAAPWVAVLPAYPSLGRQVVGGRLKVHGRGLLSTEYARDPLSPARVERVSGLFPAGLALHASLRVVARGPALLAAWLRQRPQRARFISFDCADSAHVQVIADACLRAGCRHFAGASGLGAALASRLLGPAPTPRLPRLPLVLALGSVSQTAFGQLQHAHTQGALTWAPVLRRQGRHWSRLGASEQAQLARRSRRGEAVALSSLASREDLGAWRERGRQQGVRAGAWAERSLKTLVRQARALSPRLGDRLWFLAGGHTLAVFMAEAGLDRLQVHGSVQPGVQLSRALGPSDSAWVLSRPGGFGSPDDLIHLVKRTRP